MKEAQVARRRLGYLHVPRSAVQHRLVSTPQVLGHPLVLFDEDARGVQRVRVASGQALRKGVMVGDTVASAAALCSGLQKLLYDEAEATQALMALGEALLEVTPAFQLAPNDGLWLDASSADYFQGEASWGAAVLQVAKRLGLVGRCVVASERFTAQALACWGVGEAVTIAPPRGGGLLAAVPMQALNGWAAASQIAPMVSLVATLGELAALPKGALAARFGATGALVARLAQGDDDSGLVPAVLPAQFEEVVRLDWPAQQLEPVVFATKVAVDRLCARLQGRAKVALALNATLSLDGAPPLVVPLTLARPTNTSKQLVELLRHRLTDLTVPAPVTGLSVRVESTGDDPGQQLRLGHDPAGEAQLEVVLARLQSALGPESLGCARVLPARRPESAWASGPFQPPDAGRIDALWGVTEAQWVLGTPDEGTPAEVEVPASVAAAPQLAREVPAHALADPYAHSLGWADAGVAHRPARPAAQVAMPPLEVPTQASRPTRVFAQPVPVDAQLSASGQLRAVTVLGRRRSVQGLWGPERLVGEWWASAFARDYYRAQVEGLGLVWLFADARDGQFYAHGLFD